MIRPLVTARSASRRRRRPPHHHHHQQQQQPSPPSNSQLLTSFPPSTSRSSLPRSPSSRSSNSYSRAHPRRTNGSADSGARSSSSWPSSCPSTRSRSSGSGRPERRSGYSRLGRLSQQQVIRVVVEEEEKKTAQETGTKMRLKISGSARSVCEGAMTRQKKTRHWAKTTTTTQDQVTPTILRSRPSLLTLDVTCPAPTAVRVHSSSSPPSLVIPDHLLLTRPGMYSPRALPLHLVLDRLLLPDLPSHHQTSHPFQLHHRQLLHPAATTIACRRRPLARSPRLRLRLRTLLYTGRDRTSQSQSRVRSARAAIKAGRSVSRRSCRRRTR